MPKSGRRIPVSTYRLQFTQSFTFSDAAETIPYLHALGITDCYASPYLKAVPGSTHGYNIIDPTRLNPELGDDQEYQQFIDALHAHDMGQILDVVPNHMGIDQSANPWWQDVLENGPSSKHAKIFDIDWNPVKPELENKVLLPILGEQYGIALENQEISLCYADGAFFLQYYDHHLPVDPSTWTLILAVNQEKLGEELGEDNPHFLEFQSIITALSHLPSRNERHPDQIAERYREKEVVQRRLASVCQEHAEIAQFIKDNLTLFNGTKGAHRSFDLLDTLVSNQAYRLAYWRVAAEEINYRRFFDINELAAIRMELPDVFTEFHQRIFQLLQSGAATGLRIDHIDGLYDPGGYLQQWQTWAKQELGEAEDSQGHPLFIVVEKILGKSELLCHDWVCHGTTGYDFLALLNNLFVDLQHERKFDDVYQRLTKFTGSYEDLIYHSKKLIMSSAMSSEVNALGHQLSLLSERDRRSRDFTLNSLIHAVREIIACFPVYRTYVTLDPSEGVSDRDRLYIRLATARAKRRNPVLSNLVFDFIRDLLLKEPFDEFRLDWQDINRFVAQFQQTTSPVMAKGVEDTACYTYNRLLSLNEVGSEPNQFGIGLSAFYERMTQRLEVSPYSLSATSTHDTKRGEDVRARINVLSELPQEWRKRVSRWHQLNKNSKQVIDDQTIPDRNEEYFLYQTLLGCWPFTELASSDLQHFADRIQQYMTKALREAKIHSSWLNPNAAYESAVREFISQILLSKRAHRFLKDFLPFRQKISLYGIVNSLAQVLIKITAPGIPDFYQGTELWDLNLVDPDNRHPINYNLHQQLLIDLDAIQEHHGTPYLLQQLLEHPGDGRIKLFTTRRALQYRRKHPSVFLDGQFQALEVQGPRSQHVCAFARILGEQMTVTVVPRFSSGLCHDTTPFPIGQAIWEETMIVLPQDLSEIKFYNLLTDESLIATQKDEIVSLPAHLIFQQFPVALLEKRI